MKFSIKEFLSKCAQIRKKLRVLSHFLKKSFIENFIFSLVLEFRQKFMMIFFASHRFCQGLKYAMHKK